MKNKNRPARILYVENGIGYGGAIICLRHLVRHIDKSKYLPMVITGRTGPEYQDIASEALWKHIPDRRLDIPRLQRSLTEQRWINSSPALRFLCQQVLARLDDICNFLPFFIQLLWTSWRFKADLIHANNEPLCNRAALLVAKCLNVPSICHVRGDQAGSRLMSWAYSLPNHFISVSNWVSNSMQEKLNIPEKKISVVYDGIDLNGLKLDADTQGFRKQFGITQHEFVVGLIGLLIPWKGQELFLDAAKIVKDQIPNIKMPIIGGTPNECFNYECHLKYRVKQEELESVVLFTGHISDMDSVYNALDVIVSASTSPEPLGTVVIESMAMGKLLVGPNHGGAAEMITHEKTGLLFQAESAESLAHNILRIFNDKSIIKTIGKAAREEALMKFDVHRHASEIMKIYSAILDNGTNQTRY